MALSAYLALRWRLWVAACFALDFVVRVHPVEVYTSPELFVENGTKARLSCTFKSSEVVSSKASVSWSFMPDSGGTSFALFYYSGGQPYSGKDARFKDRVFWAGDLNKKDASIYIENVHFRDNGTYSCDVKNPPDIDGSPGKTQLRVVAKENLPFMSPGLLAGIVVGAVAGLFLLVGIIVCVIYKINNSQKDYSGCSTAESLMSPVKQIPKKSSFDTEGLVNSLPTGSHQGPVIYAQLDHSGGQATNQIIKSESVVYANIRKN